ncbi:hypothetical protein FOZ62_008890, partial [Perkinsus olseni]
GNRRGAESRRRKSSEAVRRPPGGQVQSSGEQRDKSVSLETGPQEFPVGGGRSRDVLDSVTARGPSGNDDRNVARRGPEEPQPPIRSHGPSQEGRWLAQINRRPAPL